MEELKGDAPFTLVEEDAGHAGIPPVVYQTWDYNKFGKTHLKSLKQFRDLNPDLRFVLINALERDQYMEEVWGDHPIHAIYRGSRFGPMKVDVFRYCLLFERGGYYFDINKCVTVPLQGAHRKKVSAVVYYEPGSHRILPPVEVVAKLQHPDRFLAQWGFAFERAHPILKTMIDMICEYAPHFANRAYDRPKNAILQLTGPGMFTKAVWAALASNPDLEIDQKGINFEGYGDRNIPGSHIRYHTVPNYDVKQATPILQL